MTGNVCNPTRSTTSKIPPDTLIAKLSKSRNSVWVGALSAESRCTASIMALTQQNLPIGKVHVLDYEAEIEPVSLATQLPNSQWEILRGIARTSSIGGIHRHPVSPYAFQDLQGFVENLLSTSGADVVVFDITCLTKIHLLALAATLSKFPREPAWCAVYTKPESYVIQRDPGWRDMIIAPLGETGLLLNETFSRGIIIPGHEGDRLAVALSEMEASGGLVLIADTSGRPDLRYLTEKRNQRVLRRLSSPQMHAWTKRVVEEDAVDDITKYVSSEIVEAQFHKAPILLFPYGPKSLVFLVARQLSLEYAGSSWFVYPIPLGHTAEYSEGIERLIWMTPDITMF